MAVLISTNSWSHDSPIHLCYQTIADYAVYRDELDAEAYASVFTEQGEFVTPSATYIGRDALKAYIHKKDPKRPTLHQVTTVQIKPETPDRATGLIYATVQFMVTEDDKSTRLTKEAHAIYRDTYHLGEGECKIMRRELDILAARED